MTGLAVHYLNGWAMATHPADRRRPEWPPHPDRLFMALAAAHFETGGTVEEATVLCRLEEAPPVLHVSKAEARDPVTAYVPVNDTASPIKGSGKNAKALAPLGSFPLGRDRQARRFPVAVPVQPVVRFVWPTLSLSSEDRKILSTLCTKVSRIGHSASLVQVWLEQDGAVPEENGQIELVPVDQGTARHRLRIPAPGRLELLRAYFEQGERPRPTTWCGYDEAIEEIPDPQLSGTCFEHTLLVLRKVAGPTLGLESTLQVTGFLRKALLSLCNDPVPEWVSGHRPDRTPSEQDHLAFLSLAHVGREHADGHLLGLALALPRSVSQEELRGHLGRVLFDEHGFTKAIELRMGHLGEWTLELEERDYRPMSLRSEIWTAGPPAEASLRWASVTPIALDRHPKGGDRWVQIEASVRRSCRRIGLTDPAEVVITPVSMLEGSPPGRAFPRLRRGGDGGRVQHTHAVLTFPEPVRGPVLLGAGRYRGYGLCRPLRDEEEA